MFEVNPWVPSGRMDLGVEGAFDCQPSPLKHMSIDHGCADIFMTQEFLDGANIIPVLEKMGGEAMAKGMRADRLIHTGPTGRLSNGLLNIAGMNMMSQFFTSARLAGIFRSREYVLPGPFPRCTWVFPGQSR